jgi:hypothetical protein
MTRANLSRLLIPAVAALSVFVFACGGGADAPVSGAPGGDTTATHEDELHAEIPTRWAYGNASDLRSLIQSSDEVFLGRVTRVLGQHPVADPAGMAGGREAVPLTSFEVSVEKVLAGTLSPAAKVEIEQAGGLMEGPGGARTRVVLEGDKLLESGAAYLFFADYKANGKLSVPPFGRLQVMGDGSLQALAAWDDLGALKQLSGLSTSGAAARVEGAQ